VINSETTKDQGHNEGQQSKEPELESGLPMSGVTPEAKAESQSHEPHDAQGEPQHQTSESFKSWIRRVSGFFNANAGAFSALATVVIAVTTICYTYYERQQGRLMDRQLQVMEAGDRPYVGILAISAVVDPDTRAARVTAALKNFGKKPASDFWATWDFFINGVKQVGTNARGPKNRFSFYPGADQAIVATFRPEKWNRISSGQDGLMIRVSVSYRSPGGETQYSECEERQYSSENGTFMMVGGCNPTPP
jgi:hypothetical protein